MRVFTFEKLVIIEAFGIISTNTTSIQQAPNVGKEKRAREKNHCVSPLSSDMI